MFKNKLVKALAAAAFAVAGVGVAGIVNNATVQAAYAHNVGAFHYLNKKHTYKTLGYSEGFPCIVVDKGKFYIDDDNLNKTSKVDGPMKTNGYRYINGTKYYRIPLKWGIMTETDYVPAKYFAKKYNDMSYLTVYRVNHKIKALSDDMQNTDDGMWYGKGDIILVNNFSRWNHDKYVDTISPMQDGKHNADKWFAPDGSGIGGELRPSDFKKYCSKAGKNVRYLLNRGEDWYTNSSLARGGMYHKGHFYKVYSR